MRNIYIMTAWKFIIKQISLEKAETTYGSVRNKIHLFFQQFSDDIRLQSQRFVSIYYNHKYIFIVMDKSTLFRGT